ncbi:MAG: 1-pyrroline-5-carboxylate dehydrogenase [Nocardioidaceae bacterium]|nr:1-pyrroline-5-carboxylate dehydrogenase [Nocardioidaceae bacterium]
MNSASEPIPLHLAEETVALVDRWLKTAESVSKKVDPAGQRLAALLKDERGLDFTIGFVDRVIRPQDTRVAARNLAQLSTQIPRFLPWHMRTALRLGGRLGTLMPGIVVPVARRALRTMVGHLIIDARPKQLGKAIGRLTGQGVRLNINLLGEAVLGDREAERRRAGTLALLDRDDVSYVSVKVSAIAAQLSVWAFDETVDRIVERLVPLYTRAASTSTPTFINLDMEEFKDLDLTMAVFRKILDQEEFKDLEAGIVLQAYLPDAFHAMQDLQEWAARRRLAGGAPIKVRIVKGANLAMEHVEAKLHGWTPAPFPSKVETDANFKRILDWSMTPEHIDAVHLGVAGHNLFDVAFAWLLAGARGVRDGVDFEMLLGMASAQAHAVRTDVGGLILYTPVVHPREFDVAISYLVRRLEENASSDNFMSAVYELSENADLFAREKDRFLASVDLIATDPPASFRRQNRAMEDVASQPELFDNTPDTDPSIAANRAWARAITERIAESDLGTQLEPLTNAATLELLIARTHDAGDAWGALSGEERNEYLHRAGGSLASHRAQLIEVMASETGKTIAEADVEVSEAIDFAHYYAELAAELDYVNGATFIPSRLTVIAPPWNFPVAIPAGSMLAALAAGSAVIVKPAPQARRCAAEIVEALWRAGIPRDVLIYADVAEDELGQQLIAHPLVDRVILTGAWDTAVLFKSWRPEMNLLAETSGKNAIVVTPSADFDLAAADIAKSAFGHAGQKCSAASLVILVGSVGNSQRFVDQLTDAIASQRVGYPQDPTSVMGPVIEPPQGKLLRGLTQLGEGESWLLKPESLDDSGRLWSPGVRDGVRSGSDFHLTEFFGPVLGIMRASNLAEAIALQNASPYGLTAGIHTLDADELGQWLEGVQAGNLYVNRGITGAIVQRQPFGGWKRSSVGPGAKAGGPNYLIHLGSWQSSEIVEVSDRNKLSEPILNLLEDLTGHLEEDDLDLLDDIAADDDLTWLSELGISTDVSDLGVERNVFRYLPTAVVLRLGTEGNVVDLARVVLAGLRTGASFSLSSAHPVPDPLAAVCSDAVVEDDESWIRRAATLPHARIRVLGDDTRALAMAVGGNPDIAIYDNPVVNAGRIEMLPFLLEQAVSITAHRFGNLDHTFDGFLT